MWTWYFTIDRLDQEIYSPGTAISDVSNQCTAVGGDQNKEFRGNASFLRVKSPKGGWNKNKLLLYFPYWPESRKSYVFGLTDILTWALVLSLQLLWVTGFVHVPPTVYSTQFASWSFLYIVPWTRYYNLKH